MGNKNKHERRLLGLKRVKKLLSVYRGLSPDRKTDPFYSDDGELARRLLHTRVRCSCRLCGNHRKWEGLTKQEIISRLDELDQEDEVNGR